MGAPFLCLSLLLELFSLVFSLVRSTSFGTGLGGGQRGASNEPPCADCGRETWVKCTPP